MGNKCCGPASALNCDMDHPDLANHGILRKAGKPIRQSGKTSRDIEGMKR